MILIGDKPTDGCKCGLLISESDWSDGSGRLAVARVGATAPDKLMMPRRAGPVNLGGVGRDDATDEWS